MQENTGNYRETMNTASFLKENSPWTERLLICLAVVIAYASVWPNEFVFDDRYLIVGNNFLRHWSDVPQILTSMNFSGSGTSGSGFYRPLPMLLHFFVFQAFGLSTVAFHTVNIVLQALNGCLLHRFGLRAGFHKGVAFAAALLWAVHPLFSEAVAYMSSTPELLSGTFLLLGMTALLPDFTPRKVGLAAVFFILALGCTETAVVFPALAVITFFLVSDERTNVRAYLKTWPLWLAAALYLAGWFIFVHMTGYNMNGAMNGVEDPRFPAYATSILNRTLTCLATLPYYIYLVVWPHGLHMERAFPVYTTLLAGLPATGALMVIGGLAQIIWGQARRGLALSFGLLWFAIAHSPTTGILFPINALVSEHWMYLPLMGLFLGAGETIHVVLKRWPIAAASLVALAATGLMTVTFIQSETWRNPETVYFSIINNGGNPYRISDHVAYYYMKHEEFDKAIKQYEYMINTPFGRSPDWLTGVHIIEALAWLHVPLGPNDIVMPAQFEDALNTSNHIPEAKSELGKALLLSPNHIWAHKYLAMIYRHEGNTAMADFHERKIKEITQQN